MRAMAAVVAALLLAGCSSAEERAATEASESAASASRVAELAKDLAPKIRYEVTGTATTASVTVETPDGSRTQDVDVPMRSKAGNLYLEFTFVAGDFVYVSAQNGGESGFVACRITNGDGDVIATNEASGGFAIATCTGQAH